MISQHCKHSYPCLQCGRSYPYWMSISRHVKVRNGTKPNKATDCTSCDKFRYPSDLTRHLKSHWVLRVTNLNGLPHSLLSYGHLIPGERACTGRTCMIKKFFQGPSKGRYIPWAVPEDSGYWLSGVLRGWSANG